MLDGKNNEIGIAEMENSNDYVKDVNVTSDADTEIAVDTVTIKLEDGAIFTYKTTDEPEDDDMLGSVTKEYGNRKYTVTSTYQARKNYPKATVQFALGYKLDKSTKKISGRYVDPANYCTGSYGHRTESKSYNISKPNWSANKSRVKAVVKHEVKYYGKHSDGSEYLMGTHHVKQTGTVSVKSWNEKNVTLNQSANKSAID